MTDPITQLKTGDLALIGLSSDANASFMKGPADAPPAIRAALYSGACNLTTEAGLDLDEHPGFIDLGDREVPSGDRAVPYIEELVAAVLVRGARPLVLGGDHSVTYPVLRAMAAEHGPVDILHCDAHPDLYEAYNGNRLSHASPMTRIMEEGLARRLVQVGIRTLNAHQKAQADHFGVEIHPMHSFDARTFMPDLAGPVYLSFDLDALDPSAAPGVSHHEPGGLTVREALGILQRIEAPLVGADIVEYNPRRDLNAMTAMVAAKLLKEIAGQLLARE